MPIKSRSAVELRRIEMKKGFTMAEVLITLGIIAIVAAMTLPNVMQGYRKKETAAKLKKAVSMLNQAILLSSVKNDTPDQWGIENGERNTFKNYIAPYMEVSYECPTAIEDNSKDPCCNKIYSYKNDTSKNLFLPKYILKNGIAIIFDNGGTANKSQRRGTFYVFLETGANKYIWGKNVFTFNLIVEDNKKYFVTSTMDYSEKKSFCQNHLSRDGLIDICENGAKATTGQAQGYSQAITCGAMIECNGWEIPEDYPIKL